MKRFFTALGFAGFIFFSAHNVMAEPDKNINPVVVELFTSQSCSSCPAADKVLKEISEKPGVITLGCHVTYWDHLHWKDTLSQEFCTQRQRSYAAHQPGGRVYTPQMIINGEQGFVGSRKQEALQKLSMAQSAKTVKPITLQLAPDLGNLKATLPGLPEKGAYTLWAFGYTDMRRQDIASGENRGRSVDYTTPVVILRNAGSWSGKAETREIGISMENQSLKSIVVIAQKNDYGPIIAAGKIDL